ncbi:MAG: hypothetical protein IPK68_09870 [Bdellovibrionales bacterium]|nr:hypothetical protein [Bdellovibrionales bacterium]
MKKQKINQTINRRINSILDLAESIYFDDRRLPLFRRQLLDRMNEFRRELHHSLDSGRNDSNNMGDTVVTAHHDPFRYNPLAEGVWRD